MKYVPVINVAEGEYEANRRYHIRSDCLIRTATTPYVMECDPTKLCDVSTKFGVFRCRGLKNGVVKYTLTLGETDYLAFIPVSSTAPVNCYKLTLSDMTDTHTRTIISLDESYIASALESILFDDFAEIINIEGVWDTG